FDRHAGGARGSGHRQHPGVYVEADDGAAGAYLLGRKARHDTRAAADIEDAFACPQAGRGNEVLRHGRANGGDEEALVVLGRIAMVWGPFTGFALLGSLRNHGVLSLSWFRTPPA